MRWNKWSETATYASCTSSASRFRGHGCGKSWIVKKEGGEVGAAAAAVDEEDDDDDEGENV